MLFTFLRTHQAEASTLHVHTAESDEARVHSCETTSHTNARVRVCHSPQIATQTAKSLQKGDLCFRQVNRSSTKYDFFVRPDGSLRYGVLNQNSHKRAWRHWVSVSVREKLAHDMTGRVRRTAASVRHSLRYKGESADLGLGLSRFI